MRLEVVHRDRGEHEKVYVLEDAADFILKTTSLGDVSLHARDASVLVLD